MQILASMWPGWTDPFMRHARAAAARVETPLLRLSLHRRIVVFVTCVVVAIVLAFAFLGSQAVSQSTAATLQERQATAVVMARHLDDFVGDGQASLSVVATELVDDQGELERDRAGEVMDRAMQQLYLYFATLMLLTPDGQSIATAPSVAAFELSPAAHAVVERARDTQRQAVSNRLRLPTADADGMLFVAPVVHNGRVLALVAGAMPLPHPALTSLSNSLHLGETGHMEVIDADGQLLASQGLDNETTTEHPDFYLPMLRSGSAGVGRAYSAHEAEWHIMAFAPLSDAPWGVGVGQTEAETFAATVELRDRTLAAAAAALALTLGFAWIGTQSVVKPIRALTRAGERMATGDLSEPIDLPQPDEIGRLARVLDTMRQRLRRGIDEAAEWNHQLEARVRQRTRDLETSNRYLHTMMQVATAANAGTDHEPVMRIALETLVATLHVRGAWVSLYDADPPRLRLVSEYRLPPSVRACEANIDRRDALCIQALASSTVVRALREHCPARCEDDRHVLAHRPCWVAPIRVDHRPLGVLCLVGRPRQELGLEAQELLLGVAQQIGMALQKARLADDRARLEASRRMEVLRAEFLASVSHELRTPLGFIKGYATTLLRQDVHWDAAQQREFLETIDEETDHLTELVDGVLDVARAQAGRTRLSLQRLDVEQVVRRSLERMNGTIASREVRLECEPLPPIEADNSRLEQVLLNLLGNAVKYSPAETPIDISIAARGSDVQIVVMDRGIGITPSDAARIFEPFYRAQTQAAAAVGGAGLGLAVCRAILDAHGGHIWAEPREGGGTAVYLTLPANAQQRGD